MFYQRYFGQGKLEFFLADSLWPFNWRSCSKVTRTPVETSGKVNVIGCLNGIVLYNCCSSRTGQDCIVSDCTRQGLESTGVGVLSSFSGMYSFTLLPSLWTLALTTQSDILDCLQVSCITEHQKQDFPRILPMLANLPGLLIYGLSFLQAFKRLS